MRQRRAGSGLRTAAWVLVPLGLVLMLGGIGYTWTNYEGATVMSEAMSPTHRPGERLLIERTDAGEIRRGDVVLVDVPERYQSRPVLQRVR
jgi:signal peptidase I